jgi:hypothetical protein
MTGYNDASLEREGHVYQKRLSRKLEKYNLSNPDEI